MRRLIVLSCLSILARASPLLALPEGCRSIAGNPIISHKNGSTLEIHLSQPHSILQWSSFNILEHETTHFIMPSKKSAVLNRVEGGNPSTILGTLKANGKVYLINEKGIFFGKDAVVTTAGFIGSSFDILDRDFLEGKGICQLYDENQGYPYKTPSPRQGDLVLIGSIFHETEVSKLTAKESKGRVYLITHQAVRENIHTLVVQEEQVPLEQITPSPTVLPPHHSLKKATSPSKGTKAQVEYLSYEAAYASSELFYDLSLYDDFRFTPYEGLAYFQNDSMAMAIGLEGKLAAGDYLWISPRRTFNKFPQLPLDRPQTLASLAAKTEANNTPEGENLIPLPKPPPVH